jgi:hypothetical protein
MTAVTVSNGHQRPDLYAGPPISIDALPQVVNLELYRGDDFSLAIVVTNDDGSDFDLTGYTARAQIRTTHDATEILATFTATIATNVITLHLPAVQAARLVAATVWDCEIEAADLVTLVTGKVTTSPDVTRDPAAPRAPFHP